MNATTGIWRLGTQLVKLRIWQTVQNFFALITSNRCSLIMWLEIALSHKRNNSFVSSMNIHFQLNSMNAPGWLSSWVEDEQTICYYLMSNNVFMQIRKKPLNQLIFSKIGDFMPNANTIYFMEVRTNIYVQNQKDFLWDHLYLH